MHPQQETLCFLLSGPGKLSPSSRLTLWHGRQEPDRVRQHIPDRIPPGWIPWGPRAQTAPPHPFFLPVTSDHHSKLHPHLHTTGVEEDLRSPIYSLIALLLTVSLCSFSTSVPNVLLGFLFHLSHISLGGCVAQIFPYFFITLDCNTLLLRAAGMWPFATHCTTQT